MKININNLADYYAGTDITFAAAGQYHIQPGRSIVNAQTSPEFCGLVIPLEGSACFTLSGVPYIMTPGMVIHAGPGVQLDKKVIGNTTWRYALLHYQVPQHVHSSSPFFSSDFNIPVGMNPRLFDMVSQLVTSSVTPGSAAALRSRSLFHNLIEEIVVSAFRQHCDNCGSLIEDAVAFMHENYSRQFSITELAAQYGMDGKRFAELFQRHMGMAPIRYLTALRIERSKELLRISDCPVIQVAECAGYINSYYFSRIFKKITGITPTDFRAEAKAGKV